MTLDETYSMARALLDTHGLPHWSFRFDNHKRRFGVCCYSERYIGLSWAVARLNSDAEIINTLKHEIAHALTPDAGHGPVWKIQAVIIGARPEACVNQQTIATVPGRWQGRCGCAQVNNRYRRPKPGARYKCHICAQVFVYSDTQAV